MLNRLISLVVFLLFLNINPVYSDTNFLLPQKKPSIFKKTEKQLQESINNNLPVPKPRIQKKEDIASKKVEKKTEPVEIKKVEKKKEIKEKIFNSFILPKKKTNYI